MNGFSVSLPSSPPPLRFDEQPFSYPSNALTHAHSRTSRQRHAHRTSASASASEPSSPASANATSSARALTVTAKPVRSVSSEFESSKSLSTLRAQTPPPPRTLPVTLSAHSEHEAETAKTDDAGDVTVPSASTFPVPLMSPSYSAVLKEGWINKSVSGTLKSVFIRITTAPLAIQEFESDGRNHAPSVAAIHRPDEHWTFAHNPSNHTILLKSTTLSIVLVCSDAAEHKQWRSALLRVQAIINEDKPKQTTVNANADAGSDTSLSDERWPSQPIAVKPRVSSPSLQSFSAPPSVAPSPLASALGTSLSLLSSVPILDDDSDSTNASGKATAESVLSSDTRVNNENATPNTSGDALIVPRTGQPTRSQSLDELALSEFINNATHSALAAGSGIATIKPPLQAVHKVSDRTDAEEERRVKDRAYRKLFNLPDTESLVCDYSCAIQRSILLHGRMYVSDHWICFYSSVFGHKTMIRTSMDDVLLVQSAKVALVFDNSLKIFVQTGPLPIPIAVRKASGEAERSSIRKLSDRSDTNDGPSVSAIVTEEDDSCNELESLGSLRIDAGTAAAEPSTSIAPSAPLSSASAPSSPRKESLQPRFTLSGATTDTASYTLASEQLAYLISINHPNIAQHFFASFMTRDHALNLLEGLLTKRHGHSGFTSLSAIVPLSTMTPVTSTGTSPASQTRSISTPIAVVSEAVGAVKSAEKLAEKEKLGTSRSSWKMFGSLTGRATNAAVASAQSTPEKATPESLIAATPASAQPIVADAIGTASAVPAAAALATVTTETDAGETPMLDYPRFDPDTPVEVHFTPDVFPPLGHFNDATDDVLSDSAFPSMTPIQFFHIFFSDNAAFNLKRFCAASRPNESQYRLGPWTENASKCDSEGNCMRLTALTMDIGATPVGNSVTRVHRVQRWFTDAVFEGRHCHRMDVSSMTPDLSFGDVIVIVERWYFVPADDGSMRLRISGGARFKSRPWRMKPFIGLIQQRSRDDGTKGAKDFDAFAHWAVTSEEAAVKRVQRACEPIMDKSPLEQLLFSFIPTSVDCGSDSSDQLADSAAVTFADAGAIVPVHPLAIAQSPTVPRAVSANHPAPPMTLGTAPATSFAATSTVAAKPSSSKRALAKSFLQRTIAALFTVAMHLFNEWLPQMASTDRIVLLAFFALSLLLLAWPNFPWSSWLMLTVSVTCAMLSAVTRTASIAAIRSELATVRTELGTIQQLLLALQLRADQDREERRQLNRTIRIDQHHFD